MVSAAAGTGKTAVLVGRIMSLLKDNENPAAINRLLVVTYTNAAAAELKERIRAELVSEITRNPHSVHLRRQLALLNDAYIGTIHSFCLDVVREYFYIVGLDPGFRLADEAEAQMIQAEVLDALIEEKYKGTDQGFFDLVDIYGGERDDEDLKGLILKLFRFSRSMPQPERWLNEVVSMWSSQVQSVDDLKWCDELKLNISLELKGCIREIERALDLCHRPGGPDDYAFTLEQDRTALQHLLAECQKTWDELGRAFAQISLGRLRAIRSKDGVDSGLQERVRKIRDRVKERLNSIKKEMFNNNSQQRTEEIRRMAPVVESLVGLVNQFAEMYRSVKERRSILDFSDLEHYCLKILSKKEEEYGVLVPSVVALELRDRFTEILVDEYQDVNEVQEAIINLISRQEAAKSNVFMVGDVKQSIYRFRLAEPGLFLEKYYRYPKEAAAGERRVDLRHNYRSRDGIIGAVNYLFRQIMTSEIAEMNYDDESRLVTGAVFPESEDGKDLGSHSVKLVIIDSSREGVNSQSVEEEPPGGSEDGLSLEEEPKETLLLKEAQLEARMVAAEILDMRANGVKVWDRTGDYRPLAFQDIAVLLRTTKGVAQVFADELQRAGVPAYVQADTGYFEAVEVRTILSLLSIIDNPCQDIPLLAVLRSPVGKFTAAELARIRVESPGGSFYEAAQSSARNRGCPVGAKLREFFEKLEDWRTLARRKGVRELLWKLYDETGYYDYVGAMPGGAQRQANLRLLETWAGRYESTVFRGLFNFLRFVERMQENGGEMGAAPVNSEKDDAVRVMSIHRSKGLEFPVVFVAGLGRMFNFSDLNGKVLAHRRLGVGLEFVDRERSLTYPTLAKLAVRSRIRRETLAEEIRLLYVALTRSREKLVLVGTQKGLEQRIQEWCHIAGTGGDVLPEAALMRARCYLDWVAPAAARQRGGRVLWQKAGNDEQRIASDDEETYFEVEIVQAEKLADLPFVSGETSAKPPYPFMGLKDRGEESDPIREEVERRLSWEYPWGKVLGKRAKFSVTEARDVLFPFSDGQEGEQLGREITFSSHPRFFERTEGFTAAEVGSVVHLVLSRIDLAKAVDAQGVRQELQDLVAKEVISQEEAAMVDIEAVTRFCTGELGERLRRAGQSVLREIPFSLSLPVEELYPGELEGYEERVLIQGVIDCLVDEEDGYLIIDYKTDRLKERPIEELVAKYRLQLDLYAKAVTKILNKPVKEKYLYFLSHDLAVRL